MDIPHSLSELLARARWRCIAHLLLDQSALAVVIGMGGMILLLLLGTQVLEWYWVLLLTVASLAAGLYRLRKTIPSGYEVAQKIDRRLSLADTLSTATYFTRADTNGSQAVREMQRRDAEVLAHTVDVREGVPFRRSRYAYPALGLALVAFGLFAVRYAVTGSLSLQPSLVRIAYDTFFGSNPVARALRPDNLKQPRIDPSSPDSPANQDELAPDSLLDSAGEPDPNNAQGDDAKSKADQDQNGDKADNRDQGDSNDASNQDKQSQDENDKNDKQDGKKDPKAGADGSNSSLMDKLRDALSNMLNKMKPGDKDQSAQNQQKGQQNQQKSQNQKNQQQKSDQNSASDDQQQGESGDKKQSAEANGSERSSDKSTPEDAKSGIGSDDGDKSAREAAELAAMGKISQILGKRAQNVSGEVMVEVGSSKQQLKTPFAQRQAAHLEAGSEINRDEVPLIYQQFVQQYFEEIRKAPAKSSTPN